MFEKTGTLDAFFGKYAFGAAGPLGIPSESAPAHWEYAGKPVTYPQLILAHVVERAGFAGLARCVPDWKPGMVESRLNEALKRIDHDKHPRDWNRVNDAKNVARRIRKPINDINDFYQEATWALIAS